MVFDAADVDFEGCLQNVKDGRFLAAAEIRQFVLAGFVKVRAALSREAVQQAAEEVWHAAEKQEQALGAAADLLQDFAFDRRLPSSWERGDLMMKTQIPSQLLRDCHPLQAALDDLLGQGFWSMEGLGDLGWAPIRFPAGRLSIRKQGRNNSWSVLPGGLEAPKQYHVDGSWYQHHLVCPQQAIIICPILTEILPGGAGTALKLASHFALSALLAAAGEEGRSHAQLCAEAQALDTLRFPEYEICCEAGDILLLHPHLAHSSTTNVRLGAGVRLALTKRAYWVSVPPLSSPVLWPMLWAAAGTGARRPREETELVKLAERAVHAEADARVFVWDELQRDFPSEVTTATSRVLNDRLFRNSTVDGHADFGDLLLTSAEVIRCAIQAVRQRGLVCLGLARCGLGPAGGNHLGRALSECSLQLRCLMLQGNLLADAGLVALLAQAPMLRSLQTLSLACNDLTSVAAEALAEALAGGALSHLKLHDNSLGPSGAIPLAHLASAGQLRMLGLRCCTLEAYALEAVYMPLCQDDGALSLGESLRDSTLQVLDLERNQLTDVSALMFADLLSAGPALALKHLAALSLRSNAISDAQYC
eukprot:s2838_g3.t2